MSYGRRCGLRPVSPYVIVLALAVVLTASFFLPTRAGGGGFGPHGSVSEPHGSDDFAFGDNN